MFMNYEDKNVYMMFSLFYILIEEFKDLKDKKKIGKVLKKKWNFKGIF